MGIKSLILNNWKSYNGQTSIPIKQFAAIIGPNGCGKSNLLDAICFALGVNSAKLRGKKMQDQIHKLADGTSAKFASVEIIFEKSAEKDLILSGIVSFKRTVNALGNSSFEFENKTVSKKNYFEKLEQIGIPKHNKSFLVFQGDIASIASRTPKELADFFDIASIASRTPKELADFFDELSGSKSLSEEYETALRLKKEAEAELAKLFDSRKSILKEKRQLLEQKSEAESYNKIAKKLRRQKKLLLFVQKQNLEKDRERIAKEENKEKPIGILRRNEEEHKNSLDSKRNEKKNIESQTETMKEDITKLAEQLQNDSEAKSRMAEHLGIAENAFAKDKKSLKRLENLKSENAKKETLFKTELFNAKADLDAFERTNKEKKRSDKLTEKQRNEYDRLHLQFEIKAKVGLTEMDILDENLARETETCASLKEKIDLLKKREEETEKGIRENLENLNELRKSKKTTDLELKENLSKETETKTILSQKNNEIRKTREKIIAAEQKLIELNVDMRVSERDRRRVDNFNAVKTAFPLKVKGFVADLIKPIAKKYRVAVSSALGMHNLDAIVVDSRRTALDCIGELKRRRLGTATFLPLDGLKAKAIKTQNRRIASDVKLVLDLVSFRKEHQVLAEFLCGSAVYAETLDRAREVCYRRRETRNKIKAVTKNGAVISKNGNMSGGQSNDGTRSAKRFDESDRIDLEVKIAQLKEKLIDLENSIESTNNEKSTNVLKRKIEMTERQISFVEKNVRKQRTLKIEIADEIKQTKIKIEQSKKLQKEITEKYTKCDDDVNSIRKTVFSVFCLKTGIEDVKQFEEKTNAHLEMTAQKRMSLIENISRAQEKLAFEKSVSESLNDEISEIENKTKISESKINSLKLKLEHFEDEINRKNKEILNIKNKMKKLESEKRKVKDQIFSIEETVIKVADEVKQNLRNRAERDLEKERLSALEQDLIVTADMEEIDLDKISETRNMSNLDVKRIRKEIERLESELAKICPNLRSKEHLERVKQRALSGSKDFIAAKKKRQEMAAAFQAIEKKRSELFCTTVRKVDEHIGTIYKRLTESEQFPMGGNAYLTLENADYRPFEHGVFLCAMPPSKRFREIESLSGGERSVAAMALLFAAHAFRPAPFFVLDEVDAALDKANAARLVRFLQRETESKRLQCIVVSLRESFYHKAEELVGVYKDVRRASSGVLTLDLEEFDAQSGQTLGSAIRKRGRSVGVSVSSFGSDLAVE